MKHILHPIPTYIPPVVSVEEMAKDILIEIIKEPYAYIDEVTPEKMDTVKTQLVNISLDIAEEFFKEASKRHSDRQKIQTEEHIKEFSSYSSKNNKE